MGKLVTLTDNTDRPSLLEAVLETPDGLSDEQITDVVTEVFETVRSANPDEWNYDEVVAALEAKGFRRREFVEWTEA